MLCVPDAAARTLKRSVSSVLGSSDEDSSDVHDGASGVGGQIRGVNSRCGSGCALCRTGYQTEWFPFTTKQFCRRG
jgi:hypothetical protein